MEFKAKKAIYQQIVERIFGEILNGVYKAQERIPSVREYAEMVCVNPNTVMRSYDYMQRMGVIYNRRGLGYYLHEDAREIILNLRREEFRQSQAEEIFGMLRSLSITPDELRAMYQKYIEWKESEK